MSNHNAKRTRRSRGAAFLLVLIAMAMGTVLALSFLAAQEPTSVVAANIDRKAKARQIAESALKMAIDYVNEDADWRTDKTSGTWMINAALDGGTFTLYGTDPDDGDLADDSTDPVTLSVVATYDGVTHRVSAIVAPGGGGAAGSNMLLVVADAGALTAEEQSLQARFGYWGYTVSLLDDASSQAAYDAAAAANDVVFISGDVSAGSVGTKLLNTTVGVVIAKPWLHDDFGLTDANTTTSDATTATDVADNSHMITEGFSLGSLAIYQSSVSLFYATGTVASGVTVLTDRSGIGTDASLMIANAGATLHTGAAAGRRVIFPTGGTYTPDALTTAGEVILWRCLRWAAGANSLPPMRIALYEFNEQSVASPTLMGHWKLDENPPGGFGGVSVGGTGGDGWFWIKNSARVNSYDSSLGTYASQTPTDNAVVTVNSTKSDYFYVESTGYVGGDAWIGAGGNTSSVIWFAGGATLTGTQNVQATNVDFPTFGAPSGMPASSGDFDESSGNTVLNSDVTYENFKLSGTATLTISGDVTMWVYGGGGKGDDDFTMEGSSEIIIPDGSSLTLYTGQDLDIEGDAVFNGDTTGADRLTIYAYGSKHVDLKEQAVMCGTVYTNDSFHIKDDTHFYGNVFAWEEIKMEDNSQIHQDLALGGFGSGSGTLTDAADETAATNTGAYKGSNIGGGKGGFGDGGTSVEFDGSDDYVEIPHDSSYLLDGGTISMHHYPTSTTGVGPLFSKDAIGQGNGGHIYVYRSGTRISAKIESTSDDPYGTGATLYLQSGTGVVNKDAWNHVAVTWGDGQFRLYADGILVDSVNHLGGLGTSSGGTGNTEPIVIGANSNNSTAGSATPLSSDYYEGRIDDVRIYDLPIDSAQATSLAGASDPGARTAPGYVIADTSGYSTATDMLIYDTSAISWVGGGGLTFTGDTIATTANAAAASKIHDVIEDTGSFTIEMILTRALPNTTAMPSQAFGYTNTAADEHNVLIGQDDANYEVRARDSVTGVDGKLSPEFTSATDLAAGVSTSLVFTYDADAGEVRVYLDGVLDETRTVTGTINNWADTFYLVLGGAYDDTDHWNGTVTRLAVFDRAFNQYQAESVYNGEEPGDGGGGAGTARWDEED